MTELSPGTRIQYTDGRQGVVRFIGTTHFSSGLWMGIELDDESGKNDGTVAGQRYFDCSPGRGIFVRPGTVIRIPEQPLSEASEKCAEPPVNGILMKSRQSSISAETARKRQSMMGPGAQRSTPGSRLSLRSPTKSPTKVTPSQDNSSGQSSPRTTTPATTVRTSDSGAKPHLSISSRSSMGPPPPPTARAQARPSLGTALNKSARTDPPTRPSRPVARPSMVSHRQSLSTSQEQRHVRSVVGEDMSISPSIDEQEEDEEQPPRFNNGASIEVDGDQTAASPQVSPALSQNEHLDAPIPQLPVNGVRPPRAKQDDTLATSKELEQMKLKYKIMEKKRMEDRDKIKALDALKLERDKSESTMQKLQRKCQTQSQEIAEWRRQLGESENKLEDIERALVERNTEMEMAQLDKELAEEKLDAETAKLKTLEEKYEELELEAEIVRDENKELTSGMTSEERSSAGWLQMEKENQRLRDALVALRDMTQATENTLKIHVKELQDELGDYEALKSEQEKTKSALVASQTANKTLKQNLDAADDQDLVVTQLTEEKDALTKQITMLSKDVMALREDVETSKQLRDAQDETEKLLQEELDDTQKLALGRDQKVEEQAKVIDDLEHTLLRFQNVLGGLQSDLEELRANKQVNDTEKNELNAKSRAMLDLNLRLQGIAAKTQTKKLESELTRINADDTALHLSIIQQFIPETFKDDKRPVLAFLRFKRIASKADLLRSLVEENMGHLTDIAQGDPYIALDTKERLKWVSSCCYQCHNFMKGCTVEDFSKFNAALDELGPVERTLNMWIDAAKRNDTDSARHAQELQRMIALLHDLAEKTVPSSPETFADTVIGRAEMMQVHYEVIGLKLGLIEDLVRKRTVMTGDDEDLSHFNQNVGGLVDRSSTGRVIAGKVLRELKEKKDRSLTLGETSLLLFEQAQSIGNDLSQILGVLWQALLEKFNEDTAVDEPVSFGGVMKLMQESASTWLKQSSSKVSETAHAFEVTSDMLSQFQSKLEGLLSLASDLSNFSEFERHLPPWTVRAKTVREQKVVDKETAEQLRKLQSEALEHDVAMSAVHKAIEEQSLKIEMLEARSKGAKDHAITLQKLETELVEAIAERDKAASDLEDLIKEKQALSQKYKEASARLTTLNQKAVAEDRGAAATLVPLDASSSQQLAVDIEMLKEEILDLQSAVRFLKAENHRLLYPVSSTLLATTNHAWLEANPLPKSGGVSTERGVDVVAEAKLVLKGLLEVSLILRPLQLQSPPDTKAGGKQSSWRPIKETPRYLASQQREEFQRWTEWKDDLVQRASHGRQGIQITGMPFRQSKAPFTPHGQVVDVVEIVGSPP